MTSAAPTLAGSAVEPNEKVLTRSPSPAGVAPSKKEIKDTRSSGSDGGDDDDETEYPSKLPLALITVALCLAVFLVALVSDL